MKRLGIFAFLLLVATPIRAQQFRVFDLSDFVDPRLHGGELKPPSGTNPERGFSGGTNVTITRLTTGGAANYWWLDGGSNEDVAFSTISSAYYSTDRQIDVSLSYLNNRGAGLPQWQAGFAFGFYGGTPYGGDESTLELSRFLMFVSVDRTRQNVTTVPLSLDREASFLSHDTRKLYSTGYEVGFQTDIGLPVHKELSFGELSIAARFGGLKAQRLGYLDHTAHFGSRVQLNLDIGFGVEHGEHWTAGLRSVLRASATIPLIHADLHAVYAPYGTLRGGKHGGNEFALFLDKVIFARH